MLEPGATIGNYEVVSVVGMGGMGEVYRGRDRTLGRDVAIKVLPKEFSDDPDRRTRFEREAKLLASLNHPNIAAIYGFESGALVMELVEGEDLSEELSRGAFSVEKAIAIATQGTRVRSVALARWRLRRVRLLRDWS